MRKKNRYNPNAFICTLPQEEQDDIKANIEKRLVETGHEEYKDLLTDIAMKGRLSDLVSGTEDCWFAQYIKSFMRAA